MRITKRYFFVPVMHNTCVAHTMMPNILRILLVSHSYTLVLMVGRMCYVCMYATALQAAELFEEASAAGDLLNQVRKRPTRSIDYYRYLRFSRIRALSVALSVFNLSRVFRDNNDSSIFAMHGPAATGNTASDKGGSASVSDCIGTWV